MSTTPSDFAGTAAMYLLCVFGMLGFVIFILLGGWFQWCLIGSLVCAVVTFLAYLRVLSSK